MFKKAKVNSIWNWFYGDEFEEDEKYIYFYLKTEGQSKDDYNFLFTNSESLVVEVHGKRKEYGLPKPVIDVSLKVTEKAGVLRLRLEKV